MLKEKNKRGHFLTLIPAMRLNDQESFKNFHRMDVATFEMLLNLFGPQLNIVSNRKEEHITAAERLSLTLMYLASGDNMKSIGCYGYRIGASTTSKFFKHTTSVIWNRLTHVFPSPSTALWSRIAMEFEEQWGFPNCLRPIDGKHVNIHALPNYNSLTFNYKHAHSLVLMAVADANYKFTFVDIGALGRKSDGGIFENLSFGNAITNNPDELNIPPPKKLPGTDLLAPFLVLEDDAFPLRSNLLRPYPGWNTGTMPADQPKLNKGLSRARRGLENAFGISASRFCI